MKLTLRSVTRAIAICIAFCTLLGGCSLFTPDRERPILGTSIDKSSSVVVFKDKINCNEYEQNKSIKLEGDQSATFFNFDTESVKKLTFSANVQLSQTGTSGVLLGKYTDEQGIVKNVKSVISVADKKAYLISFDENSSETLYEYNIKTDISGIVVVTAEYDCGKISFWVDDEYLYKKTVDLSTLSPNYEFFGGFIGEDCDVEFKFIKIFGVGNTKKFDPQTIIEGCTDIVPDLTIVQKNGNEGDMEIGPDSMYSKTGANVVDFGDLGLDYSKPIAYSFTLNTIKVQKTWNGFRPSFLIDENGNKIKLFSLDGSISLFFYEAKTNKDISKVSSTGYTRPLKTDEEFIIYFKNGMMYVFLDGKKVAEWLLPEANYTPIFNTLFEFGTHKVTNIKIFQANDVSVY